MVLTECIDPEKVLGEMFAQELVSFKEKLAIQESNAASRLMMDSVFKKLNKGTFEKFLHVLNEYGYESLARRFKGIKLYLQFAIKIFHVVDEKVQQHTIFANLKTILLILLFFYKNKFMAIIIMICKQQRFPINTGRFNTHNYNYAGM